MGNGRISKRRRKNAHDFSFTKKFTRIYSRPRNTIHQDLHDFIKKQRRPNRQLLKSHPLTPKRPRISRTPNMPPRRQSHASKTKTNTNRNSHRFSPNRRRSPKSPKTNHTTRNTKSPTPQFLKRPIHIRQIPPNLPTIPL